MATVIEDDGTVYFRCCIGNNSFGFSLIHVAPHNRQWIAERAEEAIIEAYRIGRAEGDAERLKKVKDALQFNCVLDRG